MANLKKPIGEMIPSDQNMEWAFESYSMTEVAALMARSDTSEHLSQLPLRDSTSRVTRVVTTNDLARWVTNGCPDSKASEFSECAQRFPYNTPLEDVTDIVAKFGYVLVENEDDWVDGILSYTEVIRMLTQ